MPVLTDEGCRAWHSDDPPALTITQPWAHAIIFGRPPKDVENRTWGTSYRGRLYIHAGRSDDAAAPGSAWACGDAWHEHAHGAIIGYVTLKDCLRRADGVPQPASAWFDEDATWHWLLADPVALRRPLSCAGKLALWRVTAVQQTAIRTLDPAAPPPFPGAERRSW